MEGAFGEMWTTSFRCMNCGHVHDPVIEENRLARQEKFMALPREEPGYYSSPVLALLSGPVTSMPPSGRTAERKGLSSPLRFHAPTRTPRATGRLPHPYGLDKLDRRIQLIGATSGT
jgi:hypothetical protein